VTGRRTVAAFLAVAAVLTGGAECKRKVPSDRPPTEREVDPATAREVIIRAHSDNPYTVSVTARELDNPKAAEFWDETVAGGEYEQTLTYTSGTVIRINVEVKGKMGDRITCSIADGDWNVRSHNSAGHYRCQEEILTVR
jgi:hypothetical protein